MADTNARTTTLEISSDDGASDELTIPTALVDLLAEDDDEEAPEVVGDIALFGMAQRIHGAVHHSQGEASEEIQAIEQATLDLFEERFGQSFADLTGHDH
jgi:hypothetical protein